VNPDKLAAAGRADGEPVGDNATAAGRATNRRIELVLEPDLSELPDLSDALKIASTR
jgi:chemotaxis protein MotB